MSAGGDFGNPLRKFKLVFLGEQSGESPPGTARDGSPHTSGHPTDRRGGPTLGEAGVAPEETAPPPEGVALP